MNTHKQNKQAIREFMQDHYTDERLAMLLAHAQDGKLAYGSCCCFIGIPTVDHPALVGHGFPITLHAAKARLQWPLTAPAAEFAFFQLAPGLESHHVASDAKRRRILIPMIRAEMRRRERLALRATLKEELEECFV